MIEFYNNHILTIVTFLPLFGAIFLLFINREKTDFIRNFTLYFTTFVFFISLPIFFQFDASTADFQFVENYVFTVTF